MASSSRPSLDSGKVQPGDIFLQEEGAAHAGLIVRTDFGLSLGHAATTGLKATPLDAHPVHIFRCLNADLAREASLQAARWCRKLIRVEGKNPEYLPFASKERELQVNRLQTERNQVGMKAKGDEFGRLTAKPTGLLSSWFGSGPMAVDAALPLSEVAGMKAVMEQQDRDFVTFGRFRAIKYAARRNLAVAHIEYDNSADKGYKLGPTTTCAMFTVLCYQVAALAPYVTACSSFNEDSWISNKHGAVLDVDLADEVSMHNYLLYKQYLIDEYGKGHIREEFNEGAMKMRMSTPGSPRTGKQYRTPLSVWTGGPIGAFDFRAKLTQAMCVDAKRCRAPELLARCARDKEGWAYLGFFSFAGKEGDLKPQSVADPQAKLNPRSY